MKAHQEKWLINIKKDFTQLKDLQVFSIGSEVELRIKLVNNEDKVVGVLFSYKTEPLREIFELWGIKHNKELIEVLELFLKLANIEHQKDKFFLN